MKKILSILLLAATFWFSADGGSVTLVWDASCDNNIVGYNIYYGQLNVVTTNLVPSFTDSCGNIIPFSTNVYHCNYTNFISVGTVTNVTISNLEDGKTYFFAATSRYSSGMESSYSNEAQFTTKASPPQVMGFKSTP